MPARLLALLVVAAAPLSARAQDNPYKDAKVGDFATFKMTMEVAGQKLTGTMTSKVTAKTDKEATVEATGEVAGNKIPPQKQTIDLTKPFDPTKVGGQIPGGGDAKVEKGKEGKEKLKVGDKSYETTWTTYKVTAKAMGIDIAADTKVWMSKDIPLGMAKMEMTAEVAGMKMVMTMELDKSGNEK